MHYSLYGVITVIFFYLMFYLETLRMMLDQNENSEQLALIKSMVLTNPLLPSIYIISMTSLPFHCTVKRIRLHVFERRKIQCSTIIQFTNLNLVIKTPIWESFRKVERKYQK
jgi:peptide/nickel transport system permease protein